MSDRTDQRDWYEFAWLAEAAEAFAEAADTQPFRKVTDEKKIILDFAEPTL